MVRKLSGPEADPDIMLSEPAKAVEVPLADAGAAITPPSPELPYVALDVFCGVSGLKFDQIAGFSRWAKSQGIKALTIPAWREALLKFQNRPC